MAGGPGGRAGGSLLLKVRCACWRPHHACRAGLGYWNILGVRGNHRLRSWPPLRACAPRCLEHTLLGDTRIFSIVYKHSLGPSWDAVCLIIAPLLPGFGSMVICLPASLHIPLSPSWPHPSPAFGVPTISLGQVSKSTQFREVSALSVCLQGWARSGCSAGTPRGNLAESLGNTERPFGMLDVSGPILEFHVSRMGTDLGLTQSATQRITVCCGQSPHFAPGFPSP